MQALNQLQDDFIIQLEAELKAAKACAPRLKIRSRSKTYVDIFVCDMMVDFGCVPAGPWTVIHRSFALESIGLVGPDEFLTAIRYRPFEVTLDLGFVTASIDCDAWLLNKLLDELKPLGNTSPTNQAALAEFSAAARELVQK